MLVTPLGMFAVPLQVEPFVTTLLVIVNEPVVHATVSGGRRVISLEGSDAIDVATGVVVCAIAVNVYELPGVRPVIVQLPVEPVITHVFVASVTALIV
jgi:hypothetical protein